MGRDLKLIPISHKKSDFATEWLKMERDEDCFERLDAIEEKIGVDVPRGGITVADFPERMEFNNTGRPRMRSLLAGDLYEAFEAEMFHQWKNRAIRAYLKELPGDLPIYLYWS